MFAKVLIATIATSAMGVHIDRFSRFKINNCEGALDDTEADKYFTDAFDFNGDRSCSQFIEGAFYRACHCPEDKPVEEGPEKCTAHGRPEDDPDTSELNNYWFMNDDGTCSYVEGGENAGECNCPPSVL